MTKEKKWYVIYSFFFFFLLANILIYLFIIHFLQKFFMKIKSTFIILGLRIPSNSYYLFNTLFVPLLLTMILFIGPLYVKFLDQDLPFQKNFSWRFELHYAFANLIGFRNLIFVSKFFFNYYNPINHYSKWRL